jgi:uncharacterized protein YbjQ (UPF0145 family)
VDVATVDALLRFGLPLLLLVVVYFIGSIIERRHFNSIAARERALDGYPVTTFEAIPDAWRVGRSSLVSGNVVVSLDYFKRVVAGIRALFGGRIRTYEPLLDRARREALLRMTEAARQQGFDAVINVRVETSRLANARGNGEGTAGIEILAFGTGLVLERR